MIFANKGIIVHEKKRKITNRKERKNFECFEHAQVRQLKNKL